MSHNKEERNNNLSGQIRKESEGVKASDDLDRLLKKVTNVQKLLKIPDYVAHNIKEQLDASYKEAYNSVSAIGGSEDQIVQMWGYNVGHILYEYLKQRDTPEGRQALSFLRMNLGYTISLYGYCNEIHFANFIMGLGLRFMVGFEKLQKRINDIQKDLLKLSSIDDSKDNKKSRLLSK